MVQQVLKGSIKPIRPLDVLIFNLKWEVGFTSKIYLWSINAFKKMGSAAHARNKIP